jgi:hypothetical protein
MIKSGSSQRPSAPPTLLLLASSSSARLFTLKKCKMAMRAIPSEIGIGFQTVFVLNKAFLALLKVPNARMQVVGRQKMMMGESTRKRKCNSIRSCKWDVRMDRFGCWLVVNDDDQTEGFGFE